MDLSYNFLTSLPKKLRADELDLSHNKLSDESLPSDLIHNVKDKLDLSFNNLNTFPTQNPKLFIEHITPSLRTIDLSNNKLSTLPEVLPKELKYICRIIYWNGQVYQVT